MVIQKKKTHQHILEELHPLFKRTINILIERGSIEELQLMGIYGFVTYEEQNKLWEIGRDKNGSPIKDLEGKYQTVTSARAGQSWHNFGLAIDIGYFKNGMLLKPEENRKIYDRLGLYAEELNLVWGGRFTPWFDATHFEWSTPFKNIGEATKLHEIGGLELVWKEIFNRSI